ncbi:DUF4432 family protein [Streptomyces sp. NPDC056405]|uniref:DUF4432 family protein n=1 Tax=Streptomyces sp. NPDC056405 TaxID=3345811 RepID=UPI0035E35AB8
MDDELHLRSRDLDVVVTPEWGADIATVRDRHTDSQILYRTPWADSAHRGAWAPDSQQAWQAQYRGGWQLLCPNAGDAARVAGGTWGFHGEASLLRWQVTARTRSSAALSVRLSQAPVRIRRNVAVHGPLLRVTDTFVNESRGSVDMAVVHHPAFGAPLVSPGARIATGARTLSHHDEPHVRKPWTGSGLCTLPEQGATLAYLSDFDGHWASITREDGSLGVVLAWEGSALPHAWLWFEGRSTTALPWFGTEYVVAVEPASTIPATGVEKVSRDGGDLITLTGLSRISTTVDLAVHHDPRPVAGLRPDGTIIFQEKSNVL